MCGACNKKVGHKAKTCNWCDKICHTRCISGELGCKVCTADIIPGFHYYAWELNSNTHMKNNGYYNPFSNYDNYIGDESNMLTEIEAWEQASMCLNSCKYT